MLIRPEASPHGTRLGFAYDVGGALPHESPAGLRSLAEFGGADWIDAIMLGPYDMALNLGHCGELTHPDVIAAIENVYAQSAAIGKPCGVVVGAPEQAAFWMERGFRLLITCEVSGMVRAQARHVVNSIRKSLPG